MEMKVANKTNFVLAGNYNEYLDYVRGRDDNYTYLKDVSQLGNSGKYRLILTGTFYKHPIITSNQLNEFMNV